MNEKARLLLILFGVMSLLAFALFAQDKRMARTGRRRVPEAALLGACLCGGAAGGLLGMRLCRHKTRKPLFRWSVPVLFLLQLALFFWTLRAFPVG